MSIFDDMPAFDSTPDDALAEPAVRHTAPARVLADHAAAAVGPDVGPGGATGGTGGRRGSIYDDAADELARATSAPGGRRNSIYDETTNAAQEAAAAACDWVEVDTAAR